MTKKIGIGICFLMGCFLSFGQDSLKILEKQLPPVYIFSVYKKEEGTLMKGEDPFVCNWPPDGEERHDSERQVVWFRESSFDCIRISKDELNRF